MCARTWVQLLTLQERRELAREMEQRDVDSAKERRREAGEKEHTRLAKTRH